MLVLLCFISFSHFSSASVRKTNFGSDFLGYCSPTSTSYFEAGFNMTSFFCLNCLEISTRLCSVISLWLTCVWTSMVVHLSAVSFYYYSFPIDWIALFFCLLPVVSFHVLYFLAVHFSRLCNILLILFNTFFDPYIYFSSLQRFLTILFLVFCIVYQFYSFSFRLLRIFKT